MSAVDGSAHFHLIRKELMAYTEREVKDLQDRPDPWIARTSGMRCRTCVFFVIKEPSGPRTANPARTLGRCRRHAPTMNGYPAVFEDDWCGDHKLDENKIV